MNIIKNLRETLDSLLRLGVARRCFSGATAAIELRSGAVISASCGDTGTAQPRRANPDCLFDLASLTKPFVATAALRLVDQGALGLEQRLAEFLPKAAAAPCGDCCLQELLSHEAGLPAWLPLFEKVPDATRGTRDGAEAVLEQALAAPVDLAQRGTAVYSDLGFILLGAALEAHTGRALDDVVADLVLAPLHLASLHYRPIGAATTATDSIAATEECAWRGKLLVGEVHDDNAWASGGVSGQAGLFGAATDVARFGAAWSAWLEAGGLLSPGLARLAVSRRRSGRGLGWDCKNEPHSSAGSAFGPRTFGHLGFTGCSLWVEPELGLSVALLTNRVRYGRSNDALRPFRPMFHDGIVSAMKKAPSCDGTLS